MTTPINQIPLPSLTSPANIETSIHPMANAIDSLVVSRFTTLAARDAAIGEPAFGQTCAVSDTEEIYYWNGEAWISLAPRIRYNSTTFIVTSTTFVDHPDIFFFLEANSFYFLHCVLFLNYATANDGKFAFTFPSGASVRAHWTTVTGSDPYSVAQQPGILLVSGSQPLNGTFATITTNEALYYDVLVWAVTGATAGNIQLRLALQSGTDTAETWPGTHAKCWKLG